MSCRWTRVSEVPSNLSPAARALVMKAFEETMPGSTTLISQGSRVRYGFVEHPQADAREAKADVLKKLYNKVEDLPAGSVLTQLELLDLILDALAEL